MRAGGLREKISIRSPISTARSSDGAPIVTYSTVLSDVWARVDYQEGKELYRDRNRWDVNERDFYIRYSTVSIAPTMHIRHDDADWDIKSVINVDGRDRVIQMITEKIS